MRKSCWIIGASHGIGESLAQKYYASGYDLAISARSEDKLNNVREEILKTATEGEVLVSKVDVSDVNSLQKSLNQVLEKFSKIDLVIFAPAIYQPSSVFDFDLEKTHQIIDVNLKSVFDFLHVVLPQLTKQNSAHLAFIASVAGYRGLPNSLAYGASKAGLINLCEGIQPELKEKNIDISVINPGFVKTRLTDQNDFEMPFIISSNEAADRIYKGLKARKFEIHFPKRFTLILKFLGILPDSVYFFITRKLLKK